MNYGMLLEKEWKSLIMNKNELRDQILEQINDKSSPNTIPPYIVGNNMIDVLDTLTFQDIVSNGTASIEGDTVSFTDGTYSVVIDGRIEFNNELDESIVIDGGSIKFDGLDLESSLEWSGTGSNTLYLEGDGTVATREWSNIDNVLKSGNESFEEIRLKSDTNPLLFTNYSFERIKSNGTFYIGNSAGAAFAYFSHNGTVTFRRVASPNSAMQISLDNLSTSGTRQLRWPDEDGGRTLATREWVEENEINLTTYYSDATDYNLEVNRNNYNRVIWEGEFDGGTYSLNISNLSSERNIDIYLVGNLSSINSKLEIRVSATASNFEEVLVGDTFGSTFNTGNDLYMNVGRRYNVNIFNHNGEMYGKTNAVTPI